MIMHGGLKRIYLRWSLPLGLRVRVSPENTWLSWMG